jgi:arylsulfatase A-like enzyme
MDSPLQWTTQVASHFGETRNPIIIVWPSRITDKDCVRTQSHHIMDVMPTILEAGDIRAPEMLDGISQKPIEGISMVYTFNDANLAGRRKDPDFRTRLQPRYV